YMLLYADRELSPKQEQALLDFVQQHPELKAELDAYAATRLQPDEAVVFTGKDSLMKTEPGGKTMWLGSWKTYAAAAGVVLFVVLFSLNRNNEGVTPPAIAKKETITAPVTTAPIESASFGDQPQSQAGNIARETVSEPASRSGGKREELHSKSPVNAVAVKTTEPPMKQEPVREVHPRENETPAPLRPMAEKEEMIAQSVVEDTAQYIADAATSREKTIPEQQEAETINPQPGGKKNSFIAAVLGEKPAGLEHLEREVNEKLTTARTIREQIKNTDAEVSFRIGKKELFTVRL
ncbi:MAG TPA: hypothetical protein VIN07_01425, partial [Flavipsychrobacter sp.]